MPLTDEEKASIAAISDTPTPPEPPLTKTIGNGLKVALVAGSILGAGFLLWRWREGSRTDEARELEALPAGPVVAPSSVHCSCGTPPAAPMDPRLLGLIEAIAKNQQREIDLNVAREATLRRLQA